MGFDRLRVRIVTKHHRSNFANSDSNSNSHTYSYSHSDADCYSNSYAYTDSDWRYYLGGTHYFLAAGEPQL
jgi:hypothetical protein